MKARTKQKIGLSIVLSALSIEMYGIERASARYNDLQPLAQTIRVEEIDRSLKDLIVKDDLSTLVAKNDTAPLQAIEDLLKEKGEIMASPDYGRLLEEFNSRRINDQASREYLALVCVTFSLAAAVIGAALVLGNQKTARLERQEYRLSREARN